MSFKKLDRSLIRSLDELEDDNVENQTPRDTHSSSPALFKKKGLKGKKLRQRKTTLEFDASDEEVEQMASTSIKRNKFRSPHSFIAKRQSSKMNFDHKPITEMRKDEVKYTLDHLKELHNDQKEKNEDLKDIDEPVVVETTPAEILQEFHKNTPMDYENNDDENIIPINEYGSDDNDNYNDFSGPKTNSFPVDDDLMPDNDDIFIDDGPLNLAASMKTQKPDIDEDLYDMELPMGEEESEIELDASKPTVSKILEPRGISEHLKILKESIEKLQVSRLETESQYTKTKTEIQSITRKKEALLQELIH